MGFGRHIDSYIPTCHTHPYMLVGIDPDPYWLKIRSWLFGRVEAKADITGGGPEENNVHWGAERPHGQSGVQVGIQ
jgi:hypothetical protein